MTIPSKWFTDASRRELINFFSEQIAKEVDQLSQTPNSTDISYHTAVSRANIAWYKAMLHIADPQKYKLNPIGSRVKAPLTARQYDEWRLAVIERFTHAPPNPDPVTATYIHQLINNGVRYVTK